MKFDFRTQRPGIAEAAGRCRPEAAIPVALHHSITVQHGASIQLMLAAEGSALRLASALAIGLLIGAERERRKVRGPARSPAGIRTFAISGLLGGVSFLLGGELLLAVTAAGVAGLCAVAYVRSHERDPGLTSEAALVLTVLLGAMAQTETATASAIAVVVTILLAARTRLHRLVRNVLTPEELADALIFCAAVLVVLPLTPNRYIGPFAAINLRVVWKIVILMISISAGGYIAVRMMGARFGLPLAGFASGFVSSTATIGAMGGRAKQEPNLARPALAGAVLSSVATILEMAIVIAATSQATLLALRIPLLASGVAAAVYGGVLTFLCVRGKTPDSQQSGRPFSLKTALLLAATIALVLFLAAALHSWFGEKGVLAAVAIAGLADAHSAAVSAAALVAAGKLSAQQASIPVLAGLTTNTVSKIVVAGSTGGRRFALHVAPGLLLMLAAAWLGLALSR